MEINERMNRKEEENMKKKKNEKKLTTQPAHPKRSKTGEVTTEEWEVEELESKKYFIPTLALSEKNAINSQSFHPIPSLKQTMTTTKTATTTTKTAVEHRK